MKNFLADIKEKMDKLINRQSQEPSLNSQKVPFSKPMADSFHCPYCQSKEFVRRGWRQKKMEKIQLYLCNNCNRTFTEQITKGKHYPIELILETISYYNLGHSLEATCRFIKDLTGSAPQPSSVSSWIKEFDQLCRFSRLREFAVKLYPPEEMVATANLAHRQLYRYLYHRGKCKIMVKEDFKHRKFEPLKEFLELVPSECPHQYFQEGLRASETPLAFSKTAMIVRAKQNYANELCQFVLQSVKDRRDRHEALQKFLICNDSVTVAAEVPVYLTRDDIEHMKTQLGFQIFPRVIANVPSVIANDPSVIARRNEVTTKQSREEIAALSTVTRNDADPLPKLTNLPNEASPSSVIASDLPAGEAGARQSEIAEPVPSASEGSSPSATPRNDDANEIPTEQLPKLITGHIDILQIRNGMIHILDYKPNAAKEQPIEQLTLYAMALSRLTGLRLFEFKCAWFDEKDYFEFYPLHVLHKTKKSMRRRKIETKEGTYKVNQNEKKVEKIRPASPVIDSAHSTCSVRPELLSKGEAQTRRAGRLEKVSVGVERNQE